MEREKVLKFLDSFNNNDTMLTTYIADVNGNLRGKGANFRIVYLIHCRSILWRKSYQSWEQNVAMMRLCPRLR